MRQLPTGAKTLLSTVGLSLLSLELNLGTLQSLDSHLLILVEMHARGGLSGTVRKVILSAGSTDGSALYGREFRKGVIRVGDCKRCER